MAIFFKPPAEIDDDSQSGSHADALRRNWHDHIKGEVASHDSGLFHDPSNDPNPANAATRQPVPWNGFPRSISDWFNAESDPEGETNALAAAETLRPFILVIRDNRLRSRRAEPARQRDKRLVDRGREA